MLVVMQLFAIALLALLLSRRVRTRRSLSVPCLPLQQHSAWEAIWHTQNENGLIHTTGFDIPTFRLIHDTIAPYLFSFLNGRGGRPSRLDTYAATALALYYLNR